MTRNQEWMQGFRLIRGSEEHGAILKGNNYNGSEEFAVICLQCVHGQALVGAWDEIPAVTE